MPSASVLDVGEIVDAQSAALVDWYRTEPDDVPIHTTLADAVLAQHYCNFQIWNHEDQARRRDVSDSHIATVKRAIDGWNQRRNDLMEVLDGLVLAALPDPDPDRARQHSETAGMMIDRLSILTLKIHHMRINAARDDDLDLAAQCAEKVRTLELQLTDLAACLDRLLVDCVGGTRFFKLYRQHKAYNDPRLNPAVSGRGPSST